MKGLDFILRLRPVIYNLNIDKNDSNTIEDNQFSGKYDIQKIKFSGFIAQEVEQAAIDANFDFSGVEKPANDNDTYALKYGEFTVPLVKAVQELNEANLKLKIENTELQRQLDNVIKRLELLEK